jgi:mannose-6-phosphate isomerase-like protein (cupin superfamily)
VVASGAAGAAVVRAVRDADDPEAAARAMRAKLPTNDAVVVEGDKEVRLPQIDTLEWSLAAGATGAKPHTHGAHTDVFYVLDGELEMRLGDETVRLPAGSCAAAPPLLVHGFRNPGRSDARLLNLHASGGWASARRRFEPAQADTFGVERGNPEIRGIVRGPGDGDRLVKESRLALVKVQLPDLAVLEYAVTPAYTGADAHVHLIHADSFHVLEGALDFRLEGRTVRAEAGTSVVVPPGVEHAFTSAGRARFLNVHAPSCAFVDNLRAADAGEDVDGALYDIYELRR